MLILHAGGWIPRRTATESTFEAARQMNVTALFAGIAGLELGLCSSGHEASLFCEIEPAARAVLRHHFPTIPLVSDVRDLEQLPPETELLTAGFPCQDLSQAGTTNGICGRKSSVVAHLFRLLERSDVPHVLIENVPFMLQLQQGRAIHLLVTELERLGYRWAYRVVDTRAFGLPQRRRRVFLLGSRRCPPWPALFEDEAVPVEKPYVEGVGCGFYWTEGVRGLGWAVDAVPTLKGGSAIGIPSPPAIWMPDGRIVRPGIADAERLQGFPAGWTQPAEQVCRRSVRWKLVGNAVSVPAAGWLGRVLDRLPAAGELRRRPFPLRTDRSWPDAAFGDAASGRAGVEISSWPEAVAAPPIAQFVRDPRELSLRAVSGFIDRLTSSSLRYPPEFLTALQAHARTLRPA